MDDTQRAIDRCNRETRYLCVFFLSNPDQSLHVAVRATSIGQAWIQVAAQATYVGTSHCTSIKFVRYGMETKDGKLEWKS